MIMASGLSIDCCEVGGGVRLMRESGMPIPCDLVELMPFQLDKDIILLARL